MNIDSQTQVLKDGETAEWNGFVGQTEGGHHVQTSLWAQVKLTIGWKAERVVLKEGNRIIAGAQLLIRSIPVAGSVVYVTKGPLLTRDNRKLADLLLREITRASEKYHAQLLVIQPPKNYPSLAASLTGMGFTCSSLELAPTASVVLDVTPDPDQILAKMKRQTRQNVRRAESKGTTIREGTEADLSTFYRLHLATSRRQDFLPYSEEYFSRMWQVLRPAGYLTLIFAEYAGEAVSALLLVPFGNTVNAKILGWSGEHADRRPNDAVFWGSILWAKAHGYHFFDFEGIDRGRAMAVLRGDPMPDSVQHSPDFLKLGFGGQITFYPEAQEYIPSAVLRWLYHRSSVQVGRRTLSSKLLDRVRKR